MYCSPTMRCNREDRAPVILMEVTIWGKTDKEMENLNTLGSARALFLQYLYFIKYTGCCLNLQPHPAPSWLQIPDWEQK